MFDSKLGGSDANDTLSRLKYNDCGHWLDYCLPQDRDGLGRHNARANSRWPWRCPLQHWCQPNLQMLLFSLALSQTSNIFCEHYHFHKLHFHFYASTKSRYHHKLLCFTSKILCLQESHQWSVDTWRQGETSIRARWKLPNVLFFLWIIIILDWNCFFSHLSFSWASFSL